jgi:hypothetical protein
MRRCLRISLLLVPAAVAVLAWGAAQSGACTGPDGNRAVWDGDPEMPSVVAPELLDSDGDPDLPYAGRSGGETWLEMGGWLLRGWFLLLLG